jgi:hypothetical protein
MTHNYIVRTRAVDGNEIEELTQTVSFASSVGGGKSGLLRGKPNFEMIVEDSKMVVFWGTSQHIVHTSFRLVGG